MIANFQQPGLVVIGNPGFIIDLMKEYGETKLSTTPADENLTNVRESQLLSILDMTSDRLMPYFSEVNRIDWDRSMIQSILY